MRRLIYFGLIVGIASARLFAQDLVILPGASAVGPEPTAESDPVLQLPTLVNDSRGQVQSVDETPAAPAAIPRPTPVAPRDVEVGDDWTLTIAPAGPVAAPMSLASDYHRAYDAIPFSRAEWLANASYRHDSAMSLVTGHPINGRTRATRELERYQNPRNFQRTFFPRLAPADLQYNAVYGRYPFSYYGGLFGGNFGGYGGYGFGDRAW